MVVYSHGTAAVCPPYVSLGLALMDTWADSPHLLTEIYQYERWCSHTSRIPIASTRCFTPKISKAHVSSGWVTGLHAQKLVPQRPLNDGLLRKPLEVAVRVPLSSVRRHDHDNGQHFPKAARCQRPWQQDTDLVHWSQHKAGRMLNPIVSEPMRRTPDPAGSTCAQSLQYPRGSTYPGRGNRQQSIQPGARRRAHQGRGKTHPSDQ